MYDRAIQINPNDSNLYRNKGMECFIYHKGLTLSKQGRVEDAIKMFDRALKLNPKDSDTYY